MRISIAERLRPFCHVPGTLTVLPGWGYQIQIFPCLIRISHLKKSLPSLLTELNLDLKGPIEQFTICNDLEKGCITVSGKTAEGWMRYHLISAAHQEGIRLLVERAPIHGFSISEEGHQHTLFDKEWLDLLTKGSSFEPYQVPPCDRLSLGSHKAQDWELIQRRLNLIEALPFVHRLGQLIPSIPAIPASQVRQGTLSLLDDCLQSFSFDRPEKGEKVWHRFLLGCLRSMLVPQLEDSYYQGIINNQSVSAQDISCLVILSEGSRLIRRLFIQQESNHLSILPSLLPSLHCGRLIDIPLNEGGVMSLEWSKKMIRRMVIFAGQDQELFLKFRSDIKSYRLRQHLQEKGERKNCQIPLLLKKNCYYLFDNFQ